MITGEVKYFSSVYLPFSFSLQWNPYSYSLPIFSIGLSVFFLMICRNFLYILDINPLLVICSVCILDKQPIWFRCQVVFGSLTEKLFYRSSYHRILLFNQNSLIWFFKIPNKQMKAAIMFNHKKINRLKWIRTVVC